MRHLILAILIVPSVLFSQDQYSAIAKARALDKPYFEIYGGVASQFNRIDLKHIGASDPSNVDLVDKAWVTTLRYSFGAYTAYTTEYGFYGQASYMNMKAGPEEKEFTYWVIETGAMVMPTERTRFGAGFIFFQKNDLKDGDFGVTLKGDVKVIDRSYWGAIFGIDFGLAGEFFPYFGTRLSIFYKIRAL